MTADHVVVLDGYVPVIDISSARLGSAADRQAIADTIDRTCRDSGFFVVSGHGVDQGLIDRMHRATLDFFQLDTEAKAAYEATLDDPTVRGWYRTDSTVAASEGIATAPDLCELYTACRLGEPGIASPEALGDHFDVWSQPNRWPAEIEGFEAIWLEYYAALEGLSGELMALFGLALGLDETFFDAYIDDHITNLAANYYPPVDAEPRPGQYRKGPHSDWGTLTVLYQDGTGGLEVFHRASGEWLDVPVVAGSFVVNIGDLMAVWTNDRWKSTKHRVRVPPADKRSVARVSVPFFHQPNWDAVVECLPSCLDLGGRPRHEPVTSGEYLLAKINTTYNV